MKGFKGLSVGNQTDPETSVVLLIPKRNSFSSLIAFPKGN